MEELLEVIQVCDESDFKKTITITMFSTGTSKKFLLKIKPPSLCTGNGKKAVISLKFGRKHTKHEDLQRKSFINAEKKRAN